MSVVGHQLAREFCYKIALPSQLCRQWCLESGWRNKCYMKTSIHSICPVGNLFAHLQSADSACVGLLTYVLESSLWPGNFTVCTFKELRWCVCVFFQHFIFV